ncbi:MAG: FHA domain-containing protein [Planctomycetes bacterium]|nr:FHA domain-containing protein [Planctomycetota bacterium]
MEGVASYVIRRKGAAPARITPGRCLRLGRHASNDIVLDDPTISRFHARITWPAGCPGPVLTDLGSANGTILDGAVVRGTASLGERVAIGVGDVLLAGELEHPALIADDGRLECRLFSEAGARTEEGVFSAGRSLRDLLLDLERACRTGTLLLQTRDARARITLGAGRIVDATTDARAGIAAVHEALERFDRGRFTFRPDIEPSECVLSLSPRDVLAGGARATERLTKAEAWSGPRSGRFRRSGVLGARS